MQDVELVVEDLSPSGTPAPGDRTGQPHGAAPGDSPARSGAAVRHRRLAGLAAVVVLLLALVVPALVNARLEQDRLDRLAGLPGFVAPLHGPVHELWRDDSYAYRDGVTRVGDVLVGTWFTAGGHVAARGLDVATGTEVWTRRLATGMNVNGACVVTAASLSGGGGPLVVCPVVDGTKPLGAGGSTVSAIHLEVLDPSTGDLVTTIPAEPSGALLALGSDVVVGSIGGTGLGVGNLGAGEDGGSDVSATIVRRVDPRTGATIWSTRHVASDRSVGSRTVLLTAARGGVLVNRGAEAWLLGVDGSQQESWVHRDLEGTNAPVEPTVGGRLLRFSTALDNATTRVTDVDSGATVELPSGSTTLGMADDGSAPDVVITLGDALSSWDPVSGRVLWSDDHAVRGAAVVDGTVYALGDATVRALSVRSGHERWSAQPRTSEDRAITGQTSLATDGRVLLVAGQVSGTSTTVVLALDLLDGHRVWQSSLGDSPQTLEVAAGMLFSRGVDGTTTAWG